MMHWLPAVVAGALVLAGFGMPALSAPARAAQPAEVRLAQQWTPLTGPLRPATKPDDPKTESDDEPESKPDPKPEPASKPEKPAPAADPDKPLPEGKIVTVKATLGSSTSSEGKVHGMLGITSLTVDPDLAEGLGLGDKRGAMLTVVRADGPGAKSGLRAGDVVLRTGTKTIATYEDLVRWLRELKPNSESEVELWRAGESRDDLKALLSERADAGNIGAAASLARLTFQGLIVEKDNKEAARLFLKAAEGGNVDAMANYALLLKDGIGTERDEKEAAKWFLKGAEGGNDHAMTNLGTVYETGTGATKDESEAARWYRKAANAGNAYGMYRLALMLEAGRGVIKDDSEAVRYFRQASDKGLNEATAKLADKYATGRGVEKDEDEAQRLHERAAEQVRQSAVQGVAVSMFNLGLLYRSGKGVRKSDTEAAHWVSSAFKRGDKFLVNELIRNPNILSLDDRKWLQTVLNEEGAYKGAIDGKFGPSVRKAMEEMAEKP